MKKLLFLLVIALSLSAVTRIKAQEIFDAVKNKDLNLVKQIIDKESSVVNQKDKTGNTPLHGAAIIGSVPISEFLLSRGADINATNTMQSTPLHTAIENKQDDVAKFLIEKGANLNIKGRGGNTPLHAAAYSNRKELAELLIYRGADLEIRNEQNYTPLAALTRSTRNYEVAEVFVRRGANINAPWTDGATPLNYAAMYSDDRVINLLLDNNADLDTTDDNLKYTLFSTASKGHVRLLKKILDKCGDRIFANEAINKTIMRNAIVSGSLEFVKLLLSKNIPLDISASITGATPLHSIASNSNALEMMEYLAQNGADINARTNDGRSAYNIAEANGNKAALSLILKLGGNSDPQQFPVLSGPYLGQTPPGNQLKQFAPGIVYANHSTVSVSPDGTELYWGNGYSILFSKLENGFWTKPDYVSFSGKNEAMFYDDVPFVSPDNKKLFFTSKRPVDSQRANSNKENIWFVERTPSGWSQPNPVGPEVNALGLHWQVSVSNSGTLFFSGSDQTSFGNSDIYYSRFQNGQYTKPVNLGSVINTVEGESMPYIAPDESYLIFYRVVLQRPYLYISFKSKTGEWLQPKKVELPAYNCGIVSPDGKYFFCDNRWVSAIFIDQLRPKE
ncbi:MAG TPA: ankyrin repeat domain-containing protein [Melioribacteraceae bacterium]|nr:ankyrin repeat domain-containing protein [Melioribacteraceae bacterium]